jgi:hypothetical protein
MLVEQGKSTGRRGRTTGRGRDHEIRRHQDGIRRPGGRSCSTLEGSVGNPQQQWVTPTDLPGEGAGRASARCCSAVGAIRRGGWWAGCRLWVGAIRRGVVAGWDWRAFGRWRLVGRQGRIARQWPREGSTPQGVGCPLGVRAGHPTYRRASEGSTPEGVGCPPGFRAGNPAVEGLSPQRGRSAARRARATRFVRGLPAVVVRCLRTPRGQ